MPDALQGSQSQNEFNALELFIVELGVQNSQFRQWFWNIREDLADFKFLEH